MNTVVTVMALVAAVAAMTVNSFIVFAFAKFLGKSICGLKRFLRVEKLRFVN